MGARLDELVRAHGRLLEGRGGAELDGRGGAVLGGSFRSWIKPGTMAGKLNALDEKWVQVVFEPPELKVGAFEFQYGGQSEVKLEITYIDEEIRLGKGSRGSLFVRERSGVIGISSGFESSRVRVKGIADRDVERLPLINARWQSSWKDELELTEAIIIPFLSSSGFKPWRAEDGGGRRDEAPVTREEDEVQRR
ncbi:hypothetical protein RJ639_022606 [Escallonia herrerae]|uniref:Plastid lipid-associated protein/fibrillin conserved domain-containing protein n=1 Tax=Escallonia herrerae TaxID=1293975 RepID=A0AA89ACX5_9ASTE|nr:hypothetical protein RJ639_022606 [Escallonia herrerae]